jgi:hypothetical protein
MSECYYCQKNEALEYRVENPNTKEYHPTCAVCEYSFQLLKADREKYNLVKTSGNIIVIIGILTFFFKPWYYGIALILIGLSAKFSYHILVGNQADLRHEKEAEFAEKHGLYARYD